MLLALLLSACGGGDDISGVWKTPQTGAGPVEALYPGFSGLVALSAGQYGKDVAGSLFLFTENYSKISVFPGCPCMYLEKAEFSDGWLTFEAQRCDGSYVLGELELTGEDGDEVLTGSVTDEDGVSTTLDLARSGDDEAVSDEEWNLGCEAP